MKEILCSLLLFLPCYGHAQVGINTRQVAPSALLEIESRDPVDPSRRRGMLIPHVALRNKTDVTTIPSPARGLWVFNTANAGVGTQRVYKDFYYHWTGTKWQRLVTTDFVLDALIDRVYAIEDDDVVVRSATATNAPNPDYEGHNTDFTVLFNHAPTIDRGGLLTKVNNGEYFVVNTTGTYDISAFINYNPKADPERQAFLNLYLQRRRTHDERWEDMVCSRMSWGKGVGSMLRTIFLPSQPVFLQAGEEIRLIHCAPNIGSSHGKTGAPYIGSTPLCPISKSLTIRLLDFNL